MRKDGFRQWQFSGHEKGRPVNGVEAQNVFADHVNDFSWTTFCSHPVFLKILASPFAFEPDAGEVAGKRVVPDVDHLLVVSGPRNAPLQSPAADGDVTQAAFDEACHFVPAEVRLDEGSGIAIRFLFVSAI